MSKKYQIWDKVSSVITPSGKVFTAEQWKKKYPVANIDSVSIVCSSGEINGAYFGTIGQMKHLWENKGKDFSDCKSDQEILDKIEQFENAASEAAIKEAQEAANVPTDTERIAAALEYQNLLNS